MIARRIASWAIGCSAFSTSQKGLLAFDGCAKHNFLLRTMLTDSRRSRTNLLLTWLDLQEAFPSVSHNLMFSLMDCVGLCPDECQRHLLPFHHVGAYRQGVLHATHPPESWGEAGMPPQPYTIQHRRGS